ncbi:hypothetical protein DL93DRAFT_2231869 [Clavulina sp. PMI_390]|nr:hypothetical protein DL93DRAFT_2231869 [Clavulina sp. PMI_390]
MSAAASVQTSSFDAWLTTIPEFASATPARIQSLCSDIARQKAANPTAYAANVAWWRRTVRSMLDYGAQPVGGGREGEHLTLLLEDELLQRFADASVVRRRPMALVSVVNEMRLTNELVPFSEYLTSSGPSSPNTSSPASVSYFSTATLSTNLWWAMEQLGLSSGDDAGASLPYEQRWRSAAGEYVLFAAVKDAAAKLLKHHQSISSLSLSTTLYDRTTFRAAFGSVLFPASPHPPTDRDIAILLKHLQRDLGVLVSDKEVIKFVEPGQALKITQFDRNYLELMLAARNLSKQVDELNASVVDRTAKAKEYVARGRNDMAKSYLRSRASLQDLSLARLRSLETIQGVLLKIETSHGDIQIMKAYETSSSALQDLLSHPSLQAENVEQTMNRLSDALADHKEIEEAISMGGELAVQAGQSEIIDEAELDSELAVLVKEAEEERVQPSPQVGEGLPALDGTALPSIPLTGPEPVTEMRAESIQREKITN